MDINYALDNGGATWDLSGNLYHGDNGYMVGVYGKKYKYKDKSKVKAKVSKDFAFINRDMLKDNAFFGAWLNGDYLYIDISMLILSKDDAIALGKKYNQLAIWDLKNKCEITLDF